MCLYSSFVLVTSFVEESHAFDPCLLRQFELWIVNKCSFALRLTEVCCVVLQICLMRSLWAFFFKSKCMIIKYLFRSFLLSIIGVWMCCFSLLVWGNRSCELSENRFFNLLLTHGWWWVLISISVQICWLALSYIQLQQELKWEVKLFCEKLRG